MASESQTFNCKNELCKNPITIALLGPFHKCPKCHAPYCKNGCKERAIFGGVQCSRCFDDDTCKECNVAIDRTKNHCPQCLKKFCKDCKETELVDSSDFCEGCYLNFCADCVDYAEPRYEEEEDFAEPRYEEEEPRYEEEEPSYE